MYISAVGLMAFVWETSCVGLLDCTSASKAKKRLTAGQLEVSCPLQLSATAEIAETILLINVCCVARWRLLYTSINCFEIYLHPSCEPNGFCLRNKLWKAGRSTWLHFCQLTKKYCSCWSAWIVWSIPAMCYSWNSRNRLVHTFLLQ